MSVPLTFDLIICGAVSSISILVAHHYGPELAGLMGYSVVFGGVVCQASGILGFRGRNVCRFATVSLGTMVAAFADTAWRIGAGPSEEPASRLAGLSMAVMAFFCAGLTSNLLVERNHVPRNQNCLPL